MNDRSLIHIFHSHAEPRQHSFRNHRHSAFEISLILEGAGTYQVGEVVFPIEKGDIFLYHTNEPHCITDITENAPMHLLNVQFEPRYFWETSDEGRFLQTIFRRSRRGENRIPAADPLNARLRERILDADAEWAAGGVGADELIRADVLTILILLTRRETEQPENTPHGADRKPALIGRSMDYICAHVTEPLTLDAIAREANLSRAYYCSTFKRLNGISPWDYINIKRVEQALRLLRNSDDTVLSVALSCGFNNTANFNRIFRKITGLTPQEYRRSHT